MINQNINIALIGNPNTGKTSVFQLTGLNQQVGNYPGITVEKKLVSANYPIMLKEIY
jgi:ferrous iron transport protein B